MNAPEQWVEDHVNDPENFGSGLNAILVGFFVWLLSETLCKWLLPTSTTCSSFDGKLHQAQDNGYALKCDVAATVTGSQPWAFWIGLICLFAGLALCALCIDYKTFGDYNEDTEYDD